MCCDLTKFPMPLVLASFKSHLWDFTQTFQIILLLNITKPGNISFHNGKFGKVVSVWKKNTRWYKTRCYKPTLSSVSVSNCCNDKNKTKELLEGNTCRYEGRTSQGSHSRFQWVGICSKEHMFVRLHGETFWLDVRSRCTHSTWLPGNRRNGSQWHERFFPLLCILLEQATVSMLGNL